jgi:hypothetical protein
MKKLVMATLMTVLAVPLAGCIDDSKADSICPDCNPGGGGIVVPVPESIFATMPTAETYPQNVSKKFRSLTIKMSWRRC